MSRFRRLTSVRARLARLEVAGERVRRSNEAAQAHAASELTSQQRVDGLRRVLRRVNWPDPFPHFDDAAYLEQFWDWWFERETAEATAHFPTWAREALSRLCGLPDDLRAAKLRGLLHQVGQRDPFPRLHGERYVEAYRRWRREDTLYRGPSGRTWR